MSSSMQHKAFVRFSREVHYRVIHRELVEREARIYQDCAPRVCRKHGKIQLELQAVVQSLNQYHSTAN